MFSLEFGFPSGTVGFGLGTAQQLAAVVRATSTTTIEAVVAAAAAMVTPKYIISLF